MDDETIICECLKITYGEIKKAVDGGCINVECIEKETEAGSACRQCKSIDADPRFRRMYHIKEDVLDNK